ncbi:MAG: pseudouridine synthase [Cyclobacteriaceae bacterium]
MKRPNKKAPPPSSEVRLNRFIANAGVCSRREADRLIGDGQIKVNGKVVREMGFKVQKTDTVEYKGRKLKSQTHQYVLLNKPRGFITTTKDPQERKTVMSLVEKACVERIYPVGRLDRETSGLLLFTNDGETAKKLTHPSHKVRKIYQVELNKPVTKGDFEKILSGVELEDGIAPVNELAVIGEDDHILGIEIHIGRNRIVRRIFESLGYEVKKLDRVMFGSLTKKNLPRGKFRHLNPKEIMAIRGVK